MSSRILPFDLRILVVGEFEHDVGETETVEILVAPQPFEPRDVAVGDKVHRAVFGVPGIIIVVLHDHQHVVALDLLLGIEHVAADALVVTVGTFVRTGDDDGFRRGRTWRNNPAAYRGTPAFDRLDVGKPISKWGFS